MNSNLRLPLSAVTNYTTPWDTTEQCASDTNQGLDVGHAHDAEAHMLSAVRAYLGMIPMQPNAGIAKRFGKLGALLLIGHLHADS